MPAPIYQTPRYISYDMIERQLRVSQIKVTTDPLDNTGLLVEQVQDYMAQAETYIIQTILSNYVAIPFKTTTGGDFDSLLDNDEWVDTYTQIRSTFIAQSLAYIYQNYFGEAGEGTNGDMLIKQQLRIVSNFTAMAMRLDQAGNLQYKNIFNGLAPCANASQRIAKGIRQPNGMFTGQDQSYQAFISIPNYKYTR